MVTIGDLSSLCYLSIEILTGQCMNTQACVITYTKVCTSAHTAYCYY